MASRWSSLLLLAAAVSSAQVATPNLYFFVDGSSLSTEGTWVPTNPKDRAAHQTETEIDCEKRTGQCVEATADYFSGHPHIEVTYFEIVKWDHNGITASNADGICAGRTLSIGFAAKHVADEREAKVLPSEKQKACQTFGVPAHESWTLLLKNSNDWTAERNREHMQ